MKPAMANSGPTEAAAISVSFRVPRRRNRPLCVVATHGEATKPSEASAEPWSHKRALRATTESVGKANRSAICGVGLPHGVEAPSFARRAAESRLRQRKTSATALRASPCRRTRKRLQRADTEGHGKTHGPFKNCLHGKLGLLVNYDTCPKTAVEQRANQGNHPFRGFPCAAKA